VETATSIDRMLSTLNSTDVGTLDSVAEKLRQVKADLEALDQVELATRVDAAIGALGRGDLVEFKRARSFLQSKIGHLRSKRGLTPREPAEPRQT
jgi:hypothetical protein